MNTITKRMTLEAMPLKAFSLSLSLSLLQNPAEEMKGDTQLQGVKDVEEHARASGMRR